MACGLKTLKDDFIKVFSFGGRTVEKTGYVHGNVSMDDTIINMSKKHVCHIPFFE